MKFYLVNIFHKCKNTCANKIYLNRSLKELRDNLSKMAIKIQSFFFDEIISSIFPILNADRNRKTWDVWWSRLWK